MSDAVALDTLCRDAGFDMPTLARLKRDLIAALKAAGIEESEARREVELIIEQVTGWKLARQIMMSDKTLDNAFLEQIQSFAERRLKREPLQYILGETGFMGLTLACRPGVLIARADTETLVEVALTLLKPVKNPLVADIGCGSGAIAIALLKSRPDCSVVALDVSAAAVDLTLENARRHEVLERLVLERRDWLDWQPQRRFCALLANPPYIPRASAASLAPEVAHFEPDLALFGKDRDGLGFYRELSRRGASFLLDGGFIAVEVGDGQAEDVGKIFGSAGWLSPQLHMDLNKLPRVVSAFRADSPF